MKNSITAIINFIVFANKKYYNSYINILIFIGVVEPLELARKHS